MGLDPGRRSFTPITSRNCLADIGISFSISPFPLPCLTTIGPAIGFIHDVVFEKYLCRHENPQAVEYYLCGPPLMIRACMRMLECIGVPAQHIAYDEF